jgi:hypothetical protein
LLTPNAGPPPQKHNSGWGGGVGKWGGVGHKNSHIKATQQRELCGFFTEVNFGDENVYCLKQESETKLSTVRLLCDVHVQYCTNV